MTGGAPGACYLVTPMVRVSFFFEVELRVRVLSSDLLAGARSLSGLIVRR